MAGFSAPLALERLEHAPLPRARLDLGFAATYDRCRLYVNLDTPLTATGNSGTVGAYSLTAPGVDLGSTPDSLSDVRFGFDARLYGAAAGPIRIGTSAQLFVPNAYNDTRGDYDTDGTYRAMFRVLVGGDVGAFTYASQLGVHVRPRDDAPTPGSPQGSELLFGAAAGIRVAVSSRPATALVLGPELYGASALRSLWRPDATALEGLLSARLETATARGPQVRVKLGAGPGLDARFGAAEWRLVLGVELFHHNESGDVR